FAGLIPVELFGRTAFPRVGETPYLLAMAPHAFHWFALRKTAEDVAARLAPVATEEVGVPPVVEVSGGWEQVLEGRSREARERDAAGRRGSGTCCRTSCARSAGSGARPARWRRCASPTPGPWRPGPEGQR